MTFTAASLSIHNYDSSNNVNFTSKDEDTTTVDYTKNTNLTTSSKAAFISDVEALISETSNPFDQDLNTTDTPTFSTIAATSATLDSVSVDTVSENVFEKVSVRCDYTGSQFLLTIPHRAYICLFKFNKGNTRTVCEICLRLTIKTSE